MIVASVVVGVVGLSGSWVLVSRREPPPRPSATEWAFGLASLVPAWLVAFWGLLGPTTGWPQAGWVASSATALVGAILTDARARRLRESTSTSHRFTQWLLGVMALVPAWLIALIGLQWGRR